MGAVDKNRGQHEEQPSRPIGLISRGIFDAHDAVDKIGGDDIKEDREQFYGGNPREDGVKQRCAGKKVPKRRRVSDYVFAECNRGTVIQDVLIPDEVVIGHIPGNFPSEQPCQQAKHEKRTEPERFKIRLGLRTADYLLLFSVSCHFLAHFTGLTSTSRF